MSNVAIKTIRGIPCYEKDGTAFLELDSVATGLGFTQEKNGILYIRWDRIERYLSDIGFPQKWGKGDYIPENIFYRLAMKAKNDVAEKFQAMVADEVIPAIRRTGGYIAGEETLSDEELMAKAFIVAQNKLAEREKRIASLVKENEELSNKVEIQTQIIEDYEPKVQYYDTILKSNEALTVTQIAADYGMSAQQLNKILHEEGFQRRVGRQWILYRENMGNGYTKSETIQFVRSDGTVGSNTITKWTQKGRLKIHNILESRGIKALMDQQDLFE